MSPKKSAVKKPQIPEPAKAQAEVPQPQETSSEVKSEPTQEAPEPEKKTETPAVPTQSSPAPGPAIPLTLRFLQLEFESLRNTVAKHAIVISELQEALAKKRKPVASSGKVQILDKQTGAIFPSKNNAYQTLLKSGDLKELVDKGVFGADPSKNTFGWYALKRELPDRFEEVKAEEQQ